jgi:hypothetical protein
MSEKPLKNEAMPDPDEAEEIQEEGTNEPEEITPPPLPEEATTPPPVPETEDVTPSTPVDVVEPEIPSPFDEKVTAETATEAETETEGEPEVITPEVVTPEEVAPTTPTAASEATPRADKPKGKNNTTLIIIIVVAVLLLLCCCCIIGFMFLSEPIDAIMREMGLSLGNVIVSLTF